MLTVTYSQCLADPTYCDDGKKGGAKLIASLGIKANEPIPLKSIFPYVTLREALWCLRVCKKSQQEESRTVTWSFIATCLSLFPALLDEEPLQTYVRNRREGKRVLSSHQLELCDKYCELEHQDIVYKIARIAVSDRLASQVAIDVLEETLKQCAIHYHDRNVEADLRDTFQGMIA